MQEFMTEQNAFDVFASAITEIMNLPDENLQNIPEEALLTIAESSMTEQIFEDSIRIIMDEYREKAVTKAEILRMKEEQLSLFAELRDSMGLNGEILPQKKAMIDFIFNKISQIFEEAANRLDVYDAKIGVQLLHPEAKLPVYAKPGDRGADIYATEDIIIPVMAYNGTGSFKIDTGLAINIPNGWALNLVPRSGLSFKTNMRIANSPGTVDQMYRSEIGILVDNIGSSPIYIKKGDRIAQLTLERNYRAQFYLVDDVNADDGRGGGFGSTGN